MSVLQRAGLASVFFCLCGGPEGTAWDYPHASARDAWRSGTFDPQAPGSAVIAVCSDSHLQFPKSPHFPRFIIDDLNDMRPSPAMLIIVGDMISTASLSFGHVPTEAQKQKARKEFLALKTDLSALAPEIAVRLVPGNHDTYPYEKDAALMREVFPEADAYGVDRVAGVPLIFLNGAHSGDLDPVQQEWLIKVAASLTPDAEAMCFVHQPALGSVIRERGIASGLRRAFAAHRGPLWLIGGHNHRNADTAFALPHTTIVQSSTATCNLTVWGGPERPGYWLYGLRAGRVCARVYRRHNKGWRSAPLAERTKARPLPEPFASTGPMAWRCLVGAGDRAFLRRHKAADAVTWWAYVTELVYAFPTELFPSPLSSLVVLAGLDHTNKDPAKRGRVYLSDDGDEWREVTPEWPSSGHALCRVPAGLTLDKALWVKISGPGYGGGVTVGGFAVHCEAPAKQ